MREMRIEYGTDETGEPTITYWLPIPPEVDPKDYDALAARVEHRVNQEITQKVTQKMTHWFVNGGTE